MVRVTASENPDDPLVLIVDYNPMGTLRLAQVFTQKGWRHEIIEDGDDAVDAYVRLRPDLVMLALDIPSLDGHVAALEMRESDPDARICFMAPRHQKDLAADAAISAGAVMWLQKPITGGLIDEAWEGLMGAIPEAPGLEDLDSLYPEDVDAKRANQAGEALVEVAALPPLPMPAAGAVPAPKASTPSAATDAGKPKRGGGGGLKILAGLLILGALAAIGGGVYLMLG